MKIPAQHLSLASRSLRGLAVLGAFAWAAVAHGQATWYLKENMLSDDVSWRSPDAWNSSPDGTGTDATAINKTDTYNTNGHLVRTVGKFSGGKLLQQGGRIVMKRATQTVEGDWEVTGSDASLFQGIRDNASYVFTVSGRLILNAPLRVLHNTNGMRGIDLTIGTLTGSSPLIIGSGNLARNTVVRLGVMHCEDFTGHILVDAGSTLAFANNQRWTAPLKVVNGGVLHLNKILTVPAATLGDRDLAPGTHTADQLKSDYGPMIAPDSTGSLVVAP